MELNPKRKSSKIIVTAVVAAALVFSFVALAAPLSSFAADGNSTSSGNMVNSTNSMSNSTNMNSTTSGAVSTNMTISSNASASTTAAQSERPQVWKGRIANLQMNGTQLSWIVTGAWALRAPAGAAIDSNTDLTFLANIEMVMPTGMARHEHHISDFQVTDATSNSTTVSVSGTATVTMREGPVQDVPIKMTIMNDNAIMLWIGPDKVDNHFGSDPMYGTLFHLNPPSSPSTTGSNTSSTPSSPSTSNSTSGSNSTQGTNSTSTSGSSTSNSTSTSSNSTSTSGNNSTAGSNSAAGTNSTSSSGSTSNSGSSGSNSTSSSTNSTSTNPISTSSNGNTIQMTAKESVNLYSWFVGDQENPTLSLKANTPVTIMIQNPTETKHELIIESNGQEVASSGDVLSGNSGQLAYTPVAAGTLQYHCEYHQDTMKGTINVQ